MMALQMILCMETKVIYCIDTDSYEVDMNHAKELEELERYCDTNGYDLIWFCHDVEEVCFLQALNTKNCRSLSKKLQREIPHFCMYLQRCFFAGEMSLQTYLCF